MKKKLNILIMVILLFLVSCSDSRLKNETEKQDVFKESKNEKILYLYDEDFKISKQIDISNSIVEIKYGSIILTERKSKERKVYDINFNEIKDTNSLPYNFLNRKNTVKSNIVSNSNGIIGQSDIKSKLSGYEIGTNADKKYYLKDSNNNKMLLENYRYLDFFDDKYIEYQYGFKFGLMDYSLNKFCEFSIFDFNLP